MLMIQRGEGRAGLTLLRGALERVGDAKFLPRFLLPMGELAAALGRFGDAAQGLGIIDETLAHCARTHEGWYRPELLRIKGDLLLDAGGDRSADAAEHCFGASLDMARQQTALFWELRSALSLARLRVSQNRRREARRLLAPVLDGFTEGFATADLRAARVLLDASR